MDERTRRVGIEILQAGADAVRDELPADWEAIDQRLADLAEALVSISMESVSETSLVIAPPAFVPPTVREFAGTNVHRYAADVAWVGGEAATMVVAHFGEPPSSARAEITGQLREGFSGEMALARDDSEHLLAAADREYVLAVSSLARLKEDRDEDWYLSVIQSILGCVGAVVQAAAGVRAGEI